MGVELVLQKELRQLKVFNQALCNSTTREGFRLLSTHSWPRLNGSLNCTGKGDGTEVPSPTQGLGRFAQTEVLFE